MSELEPSLDPTTGWVILAVLSLLWLGLGQWWGRRAKSLDGFMVAGRNVGLALGSATAVATWITSNTTMLAPQFALELGVWGMLAYSTASLGLLLFAPLAARIRRLMPRGYTSAEFFALRFGRVAWGVFLVISLFYAGTWMISMGMAGGLLIEGLTGIDYVYGMSVVLLVCTLYTVRGGLFAVIGTDFIQSVVILVCIVGLVLAVVDRVGVEEIHASLLEERPALLSVFFPAALLALFNNLLFGLGETFHSNVWWSRAFAMREGVGRRAFRLAALLWLPVPVLAGFLGLAAPAMGLSISRPELVAPTLASTLFGSVGSVVIFMVVFASIASSIDSLLAATSDLVTKEVVARFIIRDASEQKLRGLATWVTVGLALVTWLVCLPRVGSLATVLFFAGPLVASTIWPIITGLFWSRVSQTTVVAAMAFGSVLGLVAYFAIGWYVASLIAAAVSMVVTVTGGLLSRSRFDWAQMEGAA